ncbi:MAG: hypothetical protein GXY82_09975 [Methanospirillum sp.]|nr:hypothetical protein [Methanospirillum sp.]
MRVRSGGTFVAVLVIWSLVVAVFMLLNRALDLQVFFVLVLIGLLVLLEVVDPSTVQPAHVRRAKYVVAAGVVVFGWIVAGKVLEILSR